MTYFKGYSTILDWGHAFNRKRGNNLSGLMFDLKFKNMQLVIAFLGCENVIVVDYDQKFLLPLLIETNKMLMPTNVIKVTIYNSKIILIFFFKPQ
jgi:hypothetical protein